MTTEHRDELQLEVNRAFRDGGKYARRYDLYTIGKSLITKYLDIGYRETKEQIRQLCTDKALQYNSEG